MASDWTLKKKIINRSLMTKLVSIILVLASALLFLPSFSLLYPLRQKLGNYPSSEKTAGEWITISLENPVEMSFVASTDRLKSIYVNVQPLEGETFQDGEGYLITSIKYNGAVCTSVYQSLSDIQENKMQYIELDAKLKKNTSYQLCFEVLNTQRKIRAWGINASLEEPELGVQFLFLSPLSWVAYVELCVVLLMLIVIIIGWQYLKKQKQLLSIIKWGAVFFIVWAWWYIYILKSKLIGNPVMVKIYFVISVLVGLIVVIQLGIKYWEKINRPENLFLIGALFWGVIYMILLPVYTAPDEDVHFIASYDYSSRMLGEEGLSKDGKVLVRSIDNGYQELLPGKEMMNSFYSLLGTEEKEWSLEESKSRYPYSTSRNTSLLNYFFQAIGITIGRIFDLNFPLLSIMGRLTNLMAYICLVYMAIKNIPIGKWTIYVISQFPMVLELSSSYSYDVINIGMVFLFISVIFKYIHMSKQLSIIDWIKIVLLGICTVVIKGMYMPILLLIFLIPSHKKEIKKEKIGRLLVISIVVVITMLINKNLVGHISGVTSGMDIEIGHTNSRSIYSVLFDPFDLICLIGNTIVVQSDSILLSVIGQKLSWRIADILPVYLIIGFIFLLVYTFYATIDEKNGIYKREKILSMVVMILCTGLATMSMLLVNTPVESQSVVGVQGRYLLPFMPLMAVCMCNSTLKKESNYRTDYLMLGCSFLNMIGVCYILQYILNN